MRCNALFHRVLPVLTKYLIELMRIDRRFHVINRSEGERTFYRRKNEFELGFDRLWPQLVERGLVKHKEFQAILNKTEFKYSPQTSLTDKQIATLTNIVNAIHTSASQNNERQKRLGPYFWKVMQEPERRSLHPLCSITLRRTLISTESKSVWYFPILPHEVN